MGRFVRIYDSKDNCYGVVDYSKVSAFVGPYKQTKKFLWFTIEQYWIIEVHIEGRVLKFHFAIETTANNWFHIMNRDWQ